MARPGTPLLPRSTIDQLSDELVLLILGFLDIPDLLAVSRTSRYFRTLCLDPLLHAQRLLQVPSYLSSHLAHRPSLSSLRPPSRTIYLSRTHIVARALSRQLISIQLQRNLSRRPEAKSLVEHNILPSECYKPRGAAVAPSLVGARRSVERERIKDSLRRWLEGKKEMGHAQQQQQRTVEEVSVRSLVRRFTAWRNASVNECGGAGSAGEKAKPTVRTSKRRWEKGGMGTTCGDSAPPRAKVLGLRRFWEGLASGAQGVSA